MRRENGALRLTLLRATQSPRQIKEHVGFPRARGDHGFQAGIRLHQLSRLGGDVTLENPIATNSAQVHIPSGDQLQNCKFAERVRMRCGASMTTSYRLLTWRVGWGVADKGHQFWNSYPCLFLPTLLFAVMETISLQTGDFSGMLLAVHGINHFLLHPEKNCPSPVGA